MTSLVFSLMPGSAAKENAAPKITSKGEHYEMTEAIVVKNLAMIYNYAPGIKLVTDKKTGALTHDNRVFLQSFARINNGFVTDAVLRTYLFAIQKLKASNNPPEHLKANFEESLKAKAGLDKLIDYYSSYYFSDTIAKQLKEIKAEVLQAKAAAGV